MSLEKKLHMPNAVEAFYMSKMRAFAATNSRNTPEMPNLQMRKIIGNAIESVC